MNNSPTIQNRRARHDYEILDTLVAGIELRGSEVKSLRDARTSLIGSYVIVRDGQAWLKGTEIQPYQGGGRSFQPEVGRDLRLLLRKSEIVRLEKKLDEMGLTVVPLKIFWLRGKAKLQIALVRGKKKYDKRQTMKDRDQKRQIDRLVKGYR